MPTNTLELNTQLEAPVAAPSIQRAPLARTLLDVFQATAKRHEARPALIVGGDVLSYGELSSAAQRLADELAARGIGSGDRVGVRIPSGTSALYVAILGVLAAGAAYVPVDAEDPDARATSIWTGSGACAVIEGELEIIERAVPHGRAGVAPGLEDEAWVIFTSGSTGAPKGVAVTHRSAAAFVDAEARLWNVEVDDRVLAGLSVGFDASCEEIWLAWGNGAALVPAPRAIVRSGSDLGPWLAEQAITVISTVPTLAAMWDDAMIASVRLLILGGEACPTDLAWRLSATREVWNTYGPTEATVVSTAARIRPHEPVTIGRPLDGWLVAVLDSSGGAVPSGEVGELVIGGVGLGRYLDDQLDQDRFGGIASLGWERAYRTGDIVRDTGGGLTFIGRADDQVKIGGRRIELGEIEAQLRAAPGVRAAAAAVRTTRSGNPVLVGYVAGDVDPADVRAQIAEWLPFGVVPLVVVLESLPSTTAGKVDRAALPWPPPQPRVVDRLSAKPLTETEAWLADRWTEHLGPMAIAADSDFFALGGSSLSAAKLISKVRDRYPTAAVADVYRHRTLAVMAERLDRLGEPSDSAGFGTAKTPGRRWAAAQIAGLLLLVAFTAPSWLISVFAFDAWQGIGPRVPWVWLAVAWLVLVSSPGRAVLAVAARRVLLPDLKPGRYPRRGWFATRLWFIERLGYVLHVERGAGTPWAPRMARMMGAAIGREVRLASLPALTAAVRIGDGATVEPAVDLHGWWIDGGELVIGELRIGAGARVGSRSVLMPGTDIGAGAEIEPGSVVSTVVPAGERWAGSPARRVGLAGESWPEAWPARAAHFHFWQAMYGFGAVALNLVGVVAAVPALLLYEVLQGPAHSTGSAVAGLAFSSPLLAAAYILGDALVVALAFRFAARLIRPGWHPDTGGTAWALWFTGQLTQGSVKALFPLYATVYTRLWLRLHGLRVGRRTEVSTSEGLNPLVTLGDTCFVADHPMFSGTRAHRGWLHLAPIEVGDGTFIGNGAILGAGTTLGRDCLVGIETTSPGRSADGTSWLGSPPIELPRIPDVTDPARTTNPPRRLVIARGATEIVRILLPTTISIVLASLVFGALDRIGAAAGVVGAVAAAPFVIAAAGVVATFVTVALKWLIIGRYRAGEAPLWSSLVWRDEIINSCQEQLSGEWLMEKALGTPVFCAYLRALGAKIGRDVWFETLAVTEFDVVTIGDGCAINRFSCIETHLFQDRVLRIGPTEMGAGSTLGPISAILPDTRLGAGCVVGGRSVVLRGEELPAGTRWHGCPVVSD